jgi:hypothetical protein
VSDVALTDQQGPARRAEGVLQRARRREVKEVEVVVLKRIPVRDWVRGSERERVTDSASGLVAGSKLCLVASSVLRPALGSRPDLVPRQKDASDLC